MFKFTIPKSDTDKIRKCFWLYLFFLIFEGAFRKWILPSASDIFLVIRDPIALYVLIIGFKKISKSFFPMMILGITILSFLAALIFGHQNLSIAIYGFRITGIHIPAMFIFGAVLTREDLLDIGQKVLYCMVFMTILISTQYFSPQTAWVNIGIGGEGSSGFAGVVDYFRPSGTFSFIAGMVGFEFLAGSYLFYFLTENRQLPEKYRLSLYKILILSVLFFASIFLCLSRSVIIQSLILAMFTVISPIFINRSKKKIIISTAVFSCIFILLMNVDFFSIAVGNMISRFDSAANSEGDIISGTIGERYLGSYVRALTNPQNFQGGEVPFFGYGLGMGTNVGARLLGMDGFSLAEEEWSRIIDEMGFLLGVPILIVFRLFWSLKLSVNAFTKFIRNKDLLPYIFIPFFFIFTINRQWALPTMLGFCVVIGSLQIAAIRTSKKNR